MDKINTIPHGIRQTPKPSQSLGDKDSKETRTSREIDFSKWFGEHGSQSISSEERASEDRLIANHTEPTFCALNPNHQKPPLSQAVTCSQTEPEPWTMAFVEKVLRGDYSEPSNLLDESDLPSSSPPYSMASNLDHQKPPLSQAMTCSQTEPAPWTMAFVEKVLEGGYSEPPNLLDESDLPSSSPCPYSMASDLDHQKPSLEPSGDNRQTEPALSTMGHKESALVEPLLSTEGESTANRKLQPQPTSNEECDLMTDDQSDLDHQGSSPRQAVKRREDDPDLWLISDTEWDLVGSLFNKEVIKTKPKPRKSLNSLLFILINGNSTPLPKNPNFSSKESADRYFFRWQTNKVLEKVLLVLEKESQEPLQSYYRNLLKNLQEISDSKTRRLSTCHFNKIFGKAGSGFQGVTPIQWKLIDPLLSEKVTECGQHHRRDLNSIFSVIIKGVHSDEIPVTSNFSSRSNFYRCFADWKGDGTLKDVLTLLIQKTQGTVQSDYRKALGRLQEDPSLNYMQKLVQQDKLAEELSKRKI